MTPPNLNLHRLDTLGGPALNDIGTAVTFQTTQAHNDLSDTAKVSNTPS